MTGFGEARLQDPRWTIAVELRTVNNRHFKLSARISDSHAMVEPALEQQIREKVRRGTVQVNLRIERPHRPEDYRLNLTALASYRDQLKSLRGFDERSLDISGLLSLPGVIEDRCRKRPSHSTTGPRFREWWPRRSRGSKQPARRRARPWPRSFAPPAAPSSII